MNFSLLFLALLTSLLPLIPISSQEDSSDKTVMAIFSHPDDEMTVAPILAKYVEEGVNVILVIATDGRYGVNDFTDHEAGEGLVAMRKEEMICSAQNLGVELIHLDYHDQLRAGEGYDGHVPHARALVVEIHELVVKHKPDVLITWGPDGGTTHMDHRLTGASVTQVFVSQSWENDMRLLYFATPSNKIDDSESKILRGVDPSLLNVKVGYENRHADQALAALKCHKTQISPEFYESRSKSYKEGEKVVYFREFVAPKKQRKSIFK